MPSYVREFYNEVKSSGRQLAVFLTWHACVLGFLALVFSVPFALFAALCW